MLYTRSNTIIFILFLDFCGENGVTYSISPLVKAYAPQYNFLFYKYIACSVAVQSALHSNNFMSIQRKS